MRRGARTRSNRVDFTIAATTDGRSTTVEGRNPPHAFNKIRVGAVNVFSGPSGRVIDRRSHHCFSASARDFKDAIAIPLSTGAADALDNLPDALALNVAHADGVAKPFACTVFETRHPFFQESALERSSIYRRLELLGGGTGDVPFNRDDVREEVSIELRLIARQLDQFRAKLQTDGAVCIPEDLPYRLKHLFKALVRIRA